MGVTPKTLSEKFPVLYHMTSTEGWESIRRNGLLSTTALLDLFDVQPPIRQEIESQHRDRTWTISHPLHGSATIRDQKAMTKAGLRRCLSGALTPELWFRILNRFVFFWMERKRIDVFLNGREYRDSPQLVLELSTARLLQAHAHRVVLSPINSGSTAYEPRPRGLDTFKSLADYPWEERRRHGRTLAVELAVESNVAPIEELLDRAYLVKGGETQRILYRRPR